jgi:hypothetical protein
VSRAARRFAAVAETIATNHPADPAADQLAARLWLVDQLVDGLELANQPPTTVQPPAQPVDPAPAHRSALDAVVAHYPTSGWPLVLTAAQWSMVAGAAGWEYLPLPLTVLAVLSLLPGGRGSPPVHSTAHGRRS